MENRKSTLGYKEFITQNLDFIISYDDKNSNTILLPYRDFLGYFQQNEAAENGLIESVMEDPMSPYFAYALCFTGFGWKSINNVDKNYKNGYEMNYLFYNNIIISASEYLKTGNYVDPIEVTNKVQQGIIKPKISFHFGDFINIAIVGGVLLAIILSIVNSCLN